MTERCWDDESDKHLEARDRRYSCLKFPPFLLFLLRNITQNIWIELWKADFMGINAPGGKMVKKRPKFSMLSLWTNVYDRMGFTFAWPITIFFRNVSFQKKCTKKRKKKMEARLKKMKGHIFPLFFASMFTFSGFFFN